MSSSPPLSDAGDRIVLREAPVLRHDTTLHAAAAQARASGQRLAVVTPSATLISVPARLAALRGGWSWVVDTPGGFVSGLQGTPLTWDGTRFVTSGAAAPTDPSEKPDGVTIIVETEAVHPLTSNLVGELAEHLVAAVGARALAWSTAEREPETTYRAAEVTTRAQAVAPNASHLALLTDGLAGELVIDPEPAGVVERITSPVAWLPRDAHQLAAAAGLAERLVRDGAQRAIVTAHPGDGRGHLRPGATVALLGHAVRRSRVPTLTAEAYLDVVGLGGRVSTGPDLLAWSAPNGTPPWLAPDAVASLIRLIDEHETWPPRNVREQLQRGTEQPG